MGLAIRDQAKYWGAAALALFILLWFLNDVILPFLVGMALAYFLDPIADRLQRTGLSRTAATVVISISVILLFVLFLLLVIPTLTNQISGLSQEVPTLVNTTYIYIETQFPELFDETSSLRQAIATLMETLKARGGQMADGLISSALGVVNAVIFIVVVPVVAFYMLLDWDNMLVKLDKMLPREHAPTIRRLAHEVDTVLAGFVRGQLTVCFILGAFYGLALMAVGLRFGLLIGITAGLISFIPYVGTMVGGVMAIGLALFQFWGEPIWIAAVIAIFVFGQFVEGNFLTPKLVGGSVGLHPVWLLFALSAFGTLFGFAGMLAAVPVAAALGVLTRFGVEQYLASPLYHGQPRPPREDG